MLRSGQAALSPALNSVRRSARRSGSSIVSTDVNGHTRTPNSNKRNSLASKRKLANDLPSSEAKGKRQSRALKDAQSGPSTPKRTSTRQKSVSDAPPARKSLASTERKAVPVKKLSEKELESKYEKRLADLRAHPNNIWGTTDVFRTLCSIFEHARNEANAVRWAKYMRDQFPFFGMTFPERKALCTDLWSDVDKLSSADLRTLVCQTWYSPEREFQYFTVDLFEKYILRIYADDVQAHSSLPVQTLDFVHQFVSCGKSWWDTVDPLSTTVGKLVRKFPEELLPVMDKWNVSSCRWTVRVSLIYQLHYGKDTDEDRLFRYCLKVAHEEEFFIRKAIGWALRQHFRLSPVAVREFVKKNKNKLSALSMKEALKHDAKK
ncbi:uncharacterized protein LOC101854490 [Aplysia californica]|uniref:Uncharacterized protein LOC101854490 n=1 Tax=Aplysia californica TaxID=6500 RepID=A0ABM0JKL7_APLCA|nr:uncharacterized protein LOC101854490 [Aplysia californica]